MTELAIIPRYNYFQWIFDLIYQIIFLIPNYLGLYHYMKHDYRQAFMFSTSFGIFMLGPILDLISSLLFICTKKHDYYIRSLKSFIYVFVWIYIFEDKFRFQLYKQAILSTNLLYFTGDVHLQEESIFSDFAACVVHCMMVIVIGNFNISGSIIVLLFMLYYGIQLPTFWCSCTSWMRLFVSIGTCIIDHSLFMMIFGSFIINSIELPIGLIAFFVTRIGIFQQRYKDNFILHTPLVQFFMLICFTCFIHLYHVDNKTTKTTIQRIFGITEYE
jgi:hypothetical protein